MSLWRYAATVLHLARMLLTPEMPLAQRSSLLVWILRLCRTIRSLTQAHRAWELIR